MSKPRELDVRDSSITSHLANSKKALAGPQKESLGGVTLWGTSLASGDYSENVSPPRPTSSRFSAARNRESFSESQVKLGQSKSHNHFQNKETAEQDVLRKLASSRINDSHLGMAPMGEKDAKFKMSPGCSKINSGNNIFGPAIAPARSPPPKIEPFVETPKRGNIKTTLKGYTDAVKFA